MGGSEAKPTQVFWKLTEMINAFKVWIVITYRDSIGIIKSNWGPQIILKRFL